MLGVSIWLWVISLEAYWGARSCYLQAPIGSVLFISKMIRSYFLTLCIPLSFCHVWTTISIRRNDPSRKRSSNFLVELYNIITNESLICLIKRNEKGQRKCVSPSVSDTKKDKTNREQEHEQYFMIETCILPYSIYSG